MLSGRNKKKTTKQDSGEHRAQLRRDATRMRNNDQRLLSYALQFTAAGLMVGVSTWDVHRHIQANSVPVSMEQAEEVSAYKRHLKEQMADRPLKFMESYLAGGTTGGVGGRGGGSGGVAGSRGTQEGRSGE